MAGPLYDYQFESVMTICHQRVNRVMGKPSQKLKNKDIVLYFTLYNDSLMAQLSPWYLNYNEILETNFVLGLKFKYCPKRFSIWLISTETKTD